MAMRRERPRLWRALGVTVVFVPTLAAGQGAPLPLPTEPGGARPPIYTQPGPAPVQVQPPRAGTGDATTPAAPATPTPPAAETAEDAKSDRARPKVPQMTTFPELIKGVGNSGALLQP